MRDEDKSKEQLIRELRSLRKQFIEINRKSERSNGGETTRVSDDVESLAASDSSSSSTGLSTLS